MSGLRATIVEWADARIAEMLRAPRMWGSDEAVELQVLQLNQIRALALRPEHEVREPRRVLETYQAFLRQRFPSRPPTPLFVLAEKLEGTTFVETLRDFSQALRRSDRQEDPFEHAAVALKLTFQPAAHPTMSALSGYYEEFRRATRAGAKERPGTGRATKDIETATDFSLDDIEYSPANGAPGQVTLKLGHHGGQASFLADHRVRDTLTTFLTIGEWAGGGQAVSDLRVDDVETRTRAAVQLRRLLPRGPIKSVAVGGKLVARTLPVVLRADYEARILEVVSELTPAEPFDTTDEIRSIDLDSGELRLGKGRIRCHLRPELLKTVVEVGVRARVIGQRYAPLKGSPFVLVDDVNLVDHAGNEG